MNAMASQISALIVCSFVQAQSKENIKLRVAGPCDGNPPESGTKSVVGGLLRERFPLSGQSPYPGDPFTNMG